MNEIESVEYLEDNKHLIIHFKDKRKKPKIIPIESLIKDLKEENKRTLERAKDFDELSKVAEKFINKWGNPHAIVVIQQGSIAYYEGAMANPLKLLD